MKIALSDHFDYKRMLAFTMPSIVMMVFTSVYGVVDGYFVSNFVGKTPFAAVNFIMPVLMILGGLGFMFGTGGGALIARTLGEGKKEKANKLFSLLVYVTVITGVALSVLSFVLMEDIASALGAEGQMLSDCVLYGRIIVAALPFLMLQFEFQSFFVVAEKPKLGLYVTVAAGVVNMVLDALFMAVFRWGIAGAAIATAISQLVGGVIPLFYFSFRNTSLLRLTKTTFDMKSLVKTCTNGSSELMGNISMSLVSMLYNYQLLKFSGEDGIAAYGVLMYVNLIFLSVFIGFSTGIAPVVGFHFGAENKQELRGLLRKSFVVMGVSSVFMFLLSEALAFPLSYIFVGYDSSLMSLTLRGFFIYSFSFLFSGFAIFGSAFFTALSDGVTSALISFLRTLVFQTAAVMLFPIFWKIDGIWFSIVAAEVMAVAITLVFLKIKQKKFQY